MGASRHHRQLDHRQGRRQGDLLELLITTGPEFDAARGVDCRATFDSGNELEGVWSPDGSRLVYNSNRAGRQNLYEKAASGAGKEATVLESPIYKYVLRWSPDGKFLLFITPPGPMPASIVEPSPVW